MSRLHDHLTGKVKKEKELQEAKEQEEKEKKLTTDILGESS